MVSLCQYTQCGSDLKKTNYSKWRCDLHWYYIHKTNISFCSCQTNRTPPVCLYSGEGERDAVPTPSAWLTDRCLPFLLLIPYPLSLSRYPSPFRVGLFMSLTGTWEVIDHSMSGDGLHNHHAVAKCLDPEVSRSIWPSKWVMLGGYIAAEFMTGTARHSHQYPHIIIECSQIESTG